jgi:excisionase family DNA binding protein
MDQLFLSRRESAKALGISLRMLDELIASKEIPVSRIGRRVLVSRESLENFARNTR